MGSCSNEERQTAYSKIKNNVTQLTVHHIKQLSKILDVPLLDVLKDHFEIYKLSLFQAVYKDNLLNQPERLK